MFPLTSHAQPSSLACFTAAATPQEKIAACTATIETPALPATTRALALMARADAFVSAGDGARALADYDAALAITPRDASALIARGKLHAAAARDAQAEADFTAALAQDNTRADAYALRARLRAKRGAESEMRADLAEARRLAPFDLAIENLFTSDAPQAAQPSDAGATLRNRATARARAGDLAGAIADFTAALVINAGDHASREGRGVAALQSGQYNAAIADFTALMESRPGDPGPRFFRANARLQTGDANGADEDFSAFLKVHAADGEALLGRALARQMQGAYASAEADLSALLEVRPDAAPPLAQRGYVRVMLGKWADAAADLARAANLPNAPPEVTLWRFIAESRAGLPAEPALAAAAKTLPAAVWPGPIMQYFLGGLAGDEVLAAADREPDLALERLCEAYFYLGEAALLLNDSESARKMLIAAVSTCTVRHTEYAGAKAELARLAPR